MVEDQKPRYGERLATLAMTIRSNGAIKQSVHAGLGISLQSERAVALELAMGMLRRLDLAEEIPQREWYALYPSQGPRRSVVETFLEFLKSATARKAIDDSLSALPART